MHGGGGGGGSVSRAPSWLEDEGNDVLGEEEEEDSALRQWTSASTSTRLPLEKTPAMGSSSSLSSPLSDRALEKVALDSCLWKEPARQAG